MGCISCKIVKPEIFKKKNLCGKARLPGIPKAMRKNKVSPGKTDHEDPNSSKMRKTSERINGIIRAMRKNKVSPGKIAHEDPNSSKVLKGKDAAEKIDQVDMHAKVNKEIANLLVQIEKTHNKVKKTREELKGKMGKIPSHLTGCSQKVSDVSPNISVSTGANYEKRKKKDENLENDPMQGKDRSCKLAEGKRLTVEAEREKSCKPIMNYKTCEEKLRHVREIRQQLTTETNSFASENTKSKEYAKNKIGNLSGDDSFKERRNYLLNKYTNFHIKEDNNTLPGVDV